MIRNRYLLRSFTVFSGLLFASPSGAQEDEREIRALTGEFCKAMEAGDLSVIDRLFDLSAENVFYDINEGPLSPERLKRVWTAATTNYDIARFVFTDMQVELDGERALQTGSWEQTQVKKTGESRDIAGRATILWKRTPSGWKVYHYHASVTPPRPRPSPSR
jgi:ketosteroid isomerase-like protein